MRLLLIVSALLLTSACQKDQAVPAPADAGPATGSVHGSALPFEAGSLPKIADLEVPDLSKFLVSHQWCTRAAGGSRYVFTQQGTWTLRASTGESRGGTWTLLSGWLVLGGADGGGGSRRIDVQTGKVNDRVVVSLDGILYGACDQNAP